MQDPRSVRSSILTNVNKQIITHDQVVVVIDLVVIVDVITSAPLILPVGVVPTIRFGTGNFGLIPPPPLPPLLTPHSSLLTLHLPLSDKIHVKLAIILVVKLHKLQAVVDREESEARSWQHQAEPLQYAEEL